MDKWQLAIVAALARRVIPVVLAAGLGYLAALGLVDHALVECVDQASDVLQAVPK